MDRAHTPQIHGRDKWPWVFSEKLSAVFPSPFAPTQRCAPARLKASARLKIRANEIHVRRIGPEAHSLRYAGSTASMRVQQGDAFPPSSSSGAKRVWHRIVSISALSSVWVAAGVSTPGLNDIAGAPNISHASSPARMDGASLCGARLLWCSGVRHTTPSKRTGNGGHALTTTE